eukprot:3431443-Lingulodinium_polyedra.AAC.1
MTNATPANKSRTAPASPSEDPKRSHEGQHPSGPATPEGRGARALHAEPRRVPTDGAGCKC